MSFEVSFLTILYMYSVFCSCISTGYESLSLSQSCKKGGSAARRISNVHKGVGGFIETGLRSQFDDLV